MVAVGALVLVALAVGTVVGMRLAADAPTEVATPTTTTTEVVTTTTTAPQRLSYSAEELASEFGDAVWRVEAFGCDEVWTGTAFAIDEHHLVTNHHVVSNTSRPSLVSRTGTRMSGTVIGWSQRPDLAVIRADDPMELWLEWAPADELREGERLLALGYPVPATDFTATPGSILSFQARTGRREAVRTDAAIDRGNSGGPALDSQGRVIGVVTEMAPNLEGFQLVPLVFTYDLLGELIDGIVAAPEEPVVDCGALDGAVPQPGPDEPDTWSSDADTYGDHPMLDELWEQCEGGDFEACDDLWWLAPPDSGYERFGDTCGERNEPAGWCVEIHERG
ncbi:MAG: S1C family serine protease [Acidimicrobiales bacterium]